MEYYNHLPVTDQMIGKFYPHWIRIRFNADTFHIQTEYFEDESGDHFHIIIYPAAWNYIYLKWQKFLFNQTKKKRRRLSFLWRFYINRKQIELIEECFKYYKLLNYELTRAYIWTIFWKSLGTTQKCLNWIFVHPFLTSI